MTIKERIEKVADAAEELKAQGDAFALSANPDLAGSFYSKSLRYYRACFLAIGWLYRVEILAERNFDHDALMKATALRAEAEKIIAEVE